MQDLIPTPRLEVEPPPQSPRWGIVPKLVAALVVATIAGSLLSRFRDMVGPLMFALIFAYLLTPIISWVTAKTKLPWGMTVNLMYLALFILLAAGLTAAVVGLIQQSQGLYQTLVDILPDLPARLQAMLQALWTHPFQVGTFTIDLSKPILLGPFKLDLTQSNLTPLLQQVVATIQPLLGQAGAGVGSLATLTASLFGWVVFLLIISYYLLHDLRNIKPSVSQIVPEGFAYDAQRLTAELGPIWNAFFRGQITLAIVMGSIIGLTMVLLGVRYALVLGLLAAAAEFVPIIGPLVSAFTGFLIALFQPGNEFGLNQFWFAGLVLVVYAAWQQVEGNVLSPRIVGGSLNLNPAVIIIGAVIAANVAGIVGLILAAPTLATLRLFGGYVYRKMFDMDPWPTPPRSPPPRPSRSLPRWLQALKVQAGRWWTAVNARPPQPH
jgi:predicted PurR-regulated permease PerM